MLTTHDQGSLGKLGDIDKNNSNLITNVLLVEGLKHNTLSIIQFCNNGFKALFEPSKCIVNDSTSNKVILTANTYLNTYVLYLDDLLDHKVKCLAYFKDEKKLLH